MNSVRNNPTNFGNIKGRAFSTEKKQPRNRDLSYLYNDKDDSINDDVEVIEQRINELNAQKKMVWIVNT